MRKRRTAPESHLRINNHIAQICNVKSCIPTSEEHWSEEGEDQVRIMHKVKYFGSFPKQLALSLIAVGISEKMSLHVPCTRYMLNNAFCSALCIHSLLFYSVLVYMLAPYVFLSNQFHTTL